MAFTLNDIDLQMTLDHSSKLDWNPTPASWTMWIMEFYSLVLDYGWTALILKLCLNILTDVCVYLELKILASAVHKL